MINWVFKNPSVKQTIPPAHRWSARLQLIFENPPDFGLEGEYKIFTGTTKADGASYYEEDGQGVTMQRHDYTIQTGSGATTSGRVMTETDIIPLDNWPFRNPQWYGEFKLKDDFSNEADPNEAWINYLINSPAYLSIDDPTEFITTEYTTEQDLKDEYIAWLQSLSSSDGYKIINIAPHDIDIVGGLDEIDDTGTYRSSTGETGRWKRTGFQWSIKIDPQHWRQVKL
jgi:hypothetical protein